MDCTNNVSIMVASHQLIEKSNENILEFTQITEQCVLTNDDLKQLLVIVKSELVIANTAKYIIDNRPTSISENIDIQLNTLVNKLLNHIINIFILIFNHNDTQKYFKFNKATKLSIKTEIKTDNHKCEIDFETQCANNHIMGNTDTFESIYDFQCDFDYIDNCIDILIDTIILIKNLLLEENHEIKITILDSKIIKFIHISEQRITNETGPTTITREMTSEELSRAEHELDYAPITGNFMFPVLCSCIVVSVVSVFTYLIKFY